MVVDLYCGAGTFALALAGQAREVYGVEVEPAAVKDARLNAERNGIGNATFLEGDLEEVAAMGQLPDYPDVIITDPARAGMSPAVISYILDSGAKRVVYISCNPATQARDLKQLCTQGGGPYRLEALQPMDLFPQTLHVENIAVLDLA